jgi:hypothetical protein
MGNAASTASFALARAAEDGHPLLDLIRVSDVNERDHWGWTALHYAAKGNKPASVRALIGAPQIDVNAMSTWSLVTSSYLTPLMVAARERAFDALVALLEAPGIRVNESREGHHSALHWAADSAVRGENPAIVAACKCRFCFRPSFATVLAETSSQPHSCALVPPLDPPTSQSTVLAAGADAHTPASGGVAFPIVLAARAGYRETVRVLLPVSSPAALIETLELSAREAGTQGDPSGHVLLRDIISCPSLTAEIIVAAAAALDIDLTAKRALLATSRTLARETEAELQVAMATRAGDSAARMRLVALATDRRDSARKELVVSERGA